MTPPGYLYYRRAFLNRPALHAGAFVLASVFADSGYNYVSISDCDRLIRLEFDQTDPRERRNALRKADLLIDTLTGFRAALVEADARRRR
jgi:hypothetical protein